MTELTGSLRKLHIETGNPLRYFFVLDQHTPVPINDLLGQRIELLFHAQISCIYCKRKTKKSFNQGYCFVCFRKLARCDQCMLKPEQCHFHLGTCREPEWAEGVCMQKHIVYLSYTSGVKVGITRRTNMPGRWFDQGATLALPIFEVKSRRQSGLVEVALKQYFADKTQWRQMLKVDQFDHDLLSTFNALSLWPCEQWPGHEEDMPAPQRIASADKSHTFNYPRLSLPDKISSHNPEKTPSIQGTLIGMKGQYLILDTGVINIRKYTGYEVTLRF